MAQLTTSRLVDETPTAKCPPEQLRPTFGTHALCSFTGQLHKTAPRSSPFALPQAQSPPSLRTFALGGRLLRQGALPSRPFLSPLPVAACFNSLESRCRPPRGGATALCSLLVQAWRRAAGRSHFQGGSEAGRQARPSPRPAAARTAAPRVSACAALTARPRKLRAARALSTPGPGTGLWL